MNPLSNPIKQRMERLRATLPVIQNIHVPRLVKEKGELSSMDLLTPLTAAYVAGTICQSISKRMYLRALLQQIFPCCTGETNHYPRFWEFMWVLLSAPGVFPSRRYLYTAKKCYGLT
ncbi:hypothetical protein TNIN_480291 [Trichonephila inaurata madagascariensis]|uniref:Uncharacterized protein n=1 Tax=Trichonephila inaurata madagascariensis TaxID=2747483 RepID=A0A8X7BUM4_9ARAC|nr:hypothetical protein TNIN_480291 [Trichonephila inaurata madagascariensis]